MLREITTNSCVPCSRPSWHLS